MADQAQWFHAVGKCLSCSKPATGELMGFQNQKLGPYCKQCADKRIKKAKSERDKES